MIKLLEDLYLDNDNLQFILKRKNVIKDKSSKNFGKETFTNIGYYPKLEQLLRAAVMNSIKSSDYNTLQAIADRQYSLLDELSINLEGIADWL